MEIHNDNNLEVKISQCESELKELNNEINKILIELENQKIIFSEEKKELESIVILNKEDFLRYKDKIKELQKKKEIYNEKLFELKKEKEKEELKNNKDNIIEEKEIENITKITNIKELSKSLGFEIENNNNNKNENNNNIDNQENNKDIDIKILEEILKKKADYELKFNKLKEKCNEYYKIKEEQKIIINNHKDYLEDMIQNMNIYFNELNISSINENENIINEKKSKNFDDIYIQIDKISYLISKIEQIHFDIKKLFGVNIENLLSEIQQNLKNIDNKKYNNEEKLKDMIEIIKHNIEEIENIIFIFEENKNNFFNKNKNIEKEKNILGEAFILLDEQKNIDDNKCFINNNIKTENLSIQNNNSSLLLAKNISGKFDSGKLYIEREEDLIENNSQEFKVLIKNVHKICYIYDDYVNNDLYFDLKVVGLPENKSYNSFCHHLDKYSIYEIQKLTINEKESEFFFNNNYFTFKIELYNLQTAKIHIVYKKSKDLNKLSLNQKKHRQFYRKEKYGFSKEIAGQIAKISLILKGNFDIIDFTNYFLVRNKKNLNEIEYTWGGVVPNEGKETKIIFSKIKANWLFHQSINFSFNNSIEDVILYTPILFIGGNNEIIRINTSSKQTKNIMLNEKSRTYIIKYKNINEKKGEFIIEGELRNRCKGEWIIDLTDEEIEKNIPVEDKLCKFQLENIARKIIKEFDENNGNSDFEFLDFMKIALWVNKNIEYDLNYAGRNDLTSIDIFNLKAGVCDHFTRLSNALLYSLGYKVIYVRGFTPDGSEEIIYAGHAWSMIKIKNKWYPFDSTWGFISGKLPISHIFSTYTFRSDNFKSKYPNKLENKNKEIKFRYIC